LSVTSPEPGSTTPAEGFPPPQEISASDSAARLAAARNKLRAALEGLDLALNARAERAREQEDQSAEFSAVQEDRSRLAQELDAAKARLRALEAAQDDVLLRVERASAAVRAVLVSDDARALSDADSGKKALDPPEPPLDAEAIVVDPHEPSVVAEAAAIDPPEPVADTEPTSPDSHLGES
jgi:hypothetical protein